MNDQTESDARGPRPVATPARHAGLLWAIAIGGVAIAYSPMWLPRIRDAFGLELGISGPASSIVWNVIAVGALLAYMGFVERRPLASIGLRKPQGKQLEWALYLFGAVMVWQWLVLTFVPPAEDRGTETIASLPIIAVIGMIVSAAVFEEILYRGYPIERLSELTGRRWIAFAITVPLFVAPHLVFFGVQWLWTAGVGTLAIYVLYAKTRNLPACMLLHLCVNLPILIPTIAHHTGG
ncbi:CPBP family intramembrane glutamic endopeptidase [Labedella endophytica]|uniref:CPBP family intramembrane metalloprotease n=1 Tax=Labedella endophytica TaxID=1523160 RepID=A0A3S0VBG9_9MICO|nr:type II CAAX endopeptidase family protein [Labedella endophytica]RUR01535.1 CPBP family intramembrane metalloprotease [Labedella endophytica]